MALKDIETLSFVKQGPPSYAVRLHSQLLLFVIERVGEHAES